MNDVPLYINMDNVIQMNKNKKWNVNEFSLPLPYKDCSRSVSVYDVLRRYFHKHIILCTHDKCVYENEEEYVTYPFISVEDSINKFISCIDPTYSDEGDEGDDVESDLESYSDDVELDLESHSDYVESEEVVKLDNINAFSKYIQDIYQNDKDYEYHKGRVTKLEVQINPAEKWLIDVDHDKRVMFIQKKIHKHNILCTDDKCVYESEYEFKPFISTEDSIDRFVSCIYDSDSDSEEIDSDSD